MKQSLQQHGPTREPRDYLDSNMTLGQRAEAWWKDKGSTVPVLRSEDWWVMYVKWVEYAFEGIGGDYEPVKEATQ